MKKLSNKELMKLSKEQLIKAYTDLYINAENKVINAENKIAKLEAENRKIMIELTNLKEKI